MSHLPSANNRRICIYRRWSDEAQLDLTMAGTTPVPFSTAKTSEIDIAGADGTTDTSRSSGRLAYSAVSISYNFTHDISRVDSTGHRRSVLEMNRLCKEHISEVQNWAYGTGSYNVFDPTQFVIRDIIQRRFYDTGVCDPVNKTGYYFMNARCTGFAAQKVVSSDFWIIQYQITMTMDPLMHPYTADPWTFTMFAGPTDDGNGMGEVTVRIFSEDIGAMYPSRYLWTNDNISWLASTSVSDISGRSDAKTATFSFTPSIAQVFSGRVGFYNNHYMVFGLDGAEYRYHLEDISVTSGACTFIESDKIATPNEMGYTNQNGFTFTCTIVNDGSTSLDDLVTKTNSKIPTAFVWGAIKQFMAPTDQQYVITAKVKDATSFTQVTGADAGSIYYITHDFGDSFQLDDDPYNELKMSADNYGFYTLQTADSLEGVY